MRRAVPASPPTTVICFGEILWDFLPEGLFPGGAPFNVAYHLHQLGVHARVVSAVGRDLLGGELLRRLRAWGIDDRTVACHEDMETGYVRASVGPGGDAHYEIRRDVAWDRITIGPAAREAAGRARALVFGSLAQRSADNRRALEDLLAALPPGAERIFDVNLRPPFDDLGLVRACARRATVLKLNAGEAARLADRPGGSAGEEEADARALSGQTGCRFICVTAGQRGAGLLRGDAWHWEPGRPVAVADTIGAGDAFLAALVAGLLQGHDSEAQLLARACRLGEWVASHRGATPPHNPTTSL